MLKLTLYIVTYDRGTYDLTGRTKPYHWSHFLQPDDAKKSTERSGTAYQLHGMPSSFNYQGPEQVANLASTGPLNGELETGEVDADKLVRIHEILSKVPVDLDESTSWNCQNWALEGLGGLKREGFVYEDLEAGVVRNWLKEP